MKEIMKHSTIEELLKTVSDEVKASYIDEWFNLSNGAVSKEFLSKIYDSIQEEYIACAVEGERIISRECAEESFVDFKKNYDAYEAVVGNTDFCHSNEVTQHIDKFYKYFPNELVSFLFEKYISYEDSENFNKNYTLLCAKYLTGWVNDDLSKDSKDNIYAMLRLAFESGNGEQKETAMSIIENLRDKVCLQIIIDSINNDYIDKHTISYAKAVQKELEDELDLDNEYEVDMNLDNGDK